MKIKAGDTVEVIAGKDKGKRGKVTQVLRDREQVVIDGVNQMVKHLKSNQADQSGQRIEFFGPIHVSNVMFVDPNTNKKTRLGVDVVTGDDGTVQRIRKSKATNEAV